MSNKENSGPSPINDKRCMHEGCGKWGAFGFRTRYGYVHYCYDHRDEGEAQLNK